MARKVIDFRESDLRKPAQLLMKFQAPEDAISEYIRQSLSADIRTKIDDYQWPNRPSDEHKKLLVKILNQVVADAMLFADNRLSLLPDSQEISKLKTTLERNREGLSIFYPRYFHRRLLRDDLAQIPILRFTLLPIINEFDKLRSAYHSFMNPYENNLPLNGQKQRRAVIEHLLNLLKPGYIVETGSFRGTTTKYFASQFNLPVYSIEFNKYFYLYTKWQLRNFSTARIFWGDSPRLLQWLIKHNIQPAFLYLDAHWFGEPPLRQEVQLILDHWSEALICIDDFKVEGDDGYKYDRYDYVELTLDYLNLPSDSNIAVFFPAQSSQDETGLKRGAVFIAWGKNTIDVIKTCVPELLRER